jgi:septal ring factor EnvC (AmiA/AmiB activator)
MAAMRITLLTILLLATSASGEAATANPVRKVVTLLQKMQAAVTAEGEKEKELFDKFMCYCKTGTGDLTSSISAAETKISTLEADTASASSAKDSTESVLAQSRADLAAAKTAMAEATAKREKESADFLSMQADYVANIGALMKAVAALSKGMAGGFLQTSAASTVKKLVSSGKLDMSDTDREELLSFLSGPFSQGYSAAGSTEIVGLLKQLGDEMATTLADATHAEEKAQHIYNELMGAKTAESNALIKMIEEKIQKSGELAVSIAQMSNDKEDTAEALSEDQAFLAELKKSCATKEAEWEARCKTRSDELLALAETIKILNDDDALELFKKTLPGASSSFVEVAHSSGQMRSHALALLQKASQASGVAQAEGHLMLDFIKFALQGKKIGFEKVISMIDEMVATLKKEQTDDDSKKEYCLAELDTSDDKKKSLEKTISDTEASIATTEESIASATDDIAALTAAIKALDTSVAEATEQRKAENSDYKELMSSNTAAKELLGLAINRLNQFYNPKLYVPPAKVERSTMDAISQDVGGAAFVQLARRAAPAPPPETFGAYSKKTEEHGGVVAMIRLLVADLDKEMTEAETSEKDSQADYEALMKESAEKRATDSKSLADKEGDKASLEGDLQSHKADLKEANTGLAATLKYIHSLHTECDWLIKYYDVRKEMRASEVDALGKAKAVLNGADFSLLQTQSLRR